MRSPIVALLTAMVSPCVFAEELSDTPQADIDEKVYSDAAFIPSIVGRVDCAGVGLFLNVPSPAAPTVDILVQQWWTPPLATNTVRIHELDPDTTNWAFPTNVPVVFFALEKRRTLEGHPAVLIPDKLPPDYVYSITNATETAKLLFPDGDRGWFRVTRDNGLVHSFATSLWECVQTNPNTTNYYSVLRDTQRTVSMEDSWRVQLDARKGLRWLFSDASEGFLAEKLDDPLLSPVMKGNLRARLYDKFGWRYVDGDITPPQ